MKGIVSASVMLLFTFLVACGGSQSAPAPAQAVSGGEAVTSTESDDDSAADGYDDEEELTPTVADEPSGDELE